MLALPDEADYDLAVAATDGIDRWCSSTDWVLPLTASMRPQDPVAIRTAGGWGVFDRATDATGRRILMGVDRIWGFACPVVGGEATWAEIAAISRVEGYDLVVLPGLVEGGGAWRAALAAFAPTHRLHRAGGITRCRADLSSGFEPWFARRSARFRRQLRRLAREATEAGLAIEPVAPAIGDDLIDRLATIERRSWKGSRGEGLASADMARFYQLVIDRLGPDRTRCSVARLDGREVGYIVGGVRDATYRGLQLSATEDVARLGVGHLLQLHEIERLVDEGVRSYDLGMEMAYKARWSDELDATTTVAALPHP